MGRGNPEGADSVIARDSSVFIGDKLSDKNKKQLDTLNIAWVELRSYEGYKRFENILQRFSIPYKKYKGNLEADLPLIFNKIF